MSLHAAARHIASKGRGDDTVLIHMTPGEVHGLQKLAMSHGGSLTINPQTGLPEAGFLSKLLPMIAGAAAIYFTGGAAAPWVAGLSNAAVIGGGIGAIQYARTGSLSKGIMAGLGAYGGAGLAGGLMGAGAAAAEQGALGQSAAESARLGMSQAPFDAVAKEAVGQSGGLTNLSTAMANPSLGWGAPTLGKAALAAAAPMMQPTAPQMPTAPAGDASMPQRLQYNVGRPMDAAGAPITPVPDVPGYGNLGQDFGRQQNYFPNAGYQNITPEQAKAARGFAEGGLNLSGEYSRDLGAELDAAHARAEKKNDKDTMRGVAAEKSLRERLKNPKMYAAGGVADLGSYSDGGNLTRGPGDGVSDSIPAVIGGKQPAKLADGEFVVPARVVSEIGNGSTPAGARKLYGMVAKVQAARKQTTGKRGIAVDTNAERFMPA